MGKTDKSKIFAWKHKKVTDGTGAGWRILLRPWIRLAQDWTRWRVLVNMKMNL